MLFFVLVADFFVLVFNRFLFFRFSLVSVFSIFLVLVFVNGIVIFSFLVIFVFVFVNENHTEAEKQTSCCTLGAFLNYLRAIHLRS